MNILTYVLLSVVGNYYAVNWDSFVLPGTTPPPTGGFTLFSNKQVKGGLSVVLSTRTLAACKLACTNYAFTYGGSVCYAIDWAVYDNECYVFLTSALGCSGTLLNNPNVQHYKRTSLCMYTFLYQEIFQLNWLE